MSWIEKYLKNNSDVSFIYRPHPAEASNYILTNLEAKYENFHVISEYSIKQWILCCDNIFSWYSTSAIEVLMADKPLNILRPIKIPTDRELTTAKNQITIKNYNTFALSVQKQQVKFPLSTDHLFEYYEIGDTPSYVKVCNSLEKIYNDNYYHINYKKCGLGLKDRYKLIIRKFPIVYNYMYRPLKILVNKIIRKTKGKNLYIEEMKKKNKYSDEEFNRINQNIKKIILREQEENEHSRFK